MFIILSLQKFNFTIIYLKLQQLYCNSNSMIHLMNLSPRLLLSESYEARGSYQAYNLIKQFETFDKLEVEWLQNGS